MPAVKDKKPEQSLDLEADAEAKPVKAKKADAPTNTPAKAAKAPAEQKIPEGGKKLTNGIILDAEGWALNKAGQRDSRWKMPYEEAQAKMRVSRTGRTANETRAERMDAIFGGRTWKIVGEAPRYTNTPVKSMTGSSLKRYFEIENEEGDRGFVGAGELQKFVGLNLPAAQRGRKNNDKKVKNSNAFREDDESSDDTEAVSMSELDE